LKVEIPVCNKEIKNKKNRLHWLYMDERKESGLFPNTKLTKNIIKLVFMGILLLSHECLKSVETNSSSLSQIGDLSIQ
jgi:hypothetical protein